MQVGDLVRWSRQWLNGCRNAKDPYSELEHYKDQVGIVVDIGEPDNCWRVLWSDQDVCDVHYDYLEVICK